MKKVIESIVFVLTVLLFYGCNPGPQEIDYGNDGCHFCKMTIVDKIHGSELITDKGKVFKFDATECMLNYLDDDNDLQVKTLLTNYYEAPTEFINVENATFLISENLPSPMGAYLTAFKTEEAAKKVQSEKGGELYNWDSLKKKLHH